MASRSLRDVVELGGARSFALTETGSRVFSEDPRATCTRFGRE